MNIERINALHDPRFRENVLKQHGAFLADGRPCEIEITGERTATVYCEDSACIDELIELFRYFAEHITVFHAPDGTLLREFAPVELFEIEIGEIQPSQFYVNADKLAAVSSFIKTGRDVIVPLNIVDRRYISMDGHTRLRRALDLGEKKVLGFITETNDALLWFVDQAKQRGIDGVKDMEIVSAEEYEAKWMRFCDDHFAQDERTDEV